MKTKIINLVASTSILLFNGCANSVPTFSDSGTFIPSPKDVENMIFNKKLTKEEAANQSQDPQITSAIYEAKMSKVTNIEFGKALINIEKKRIYETDSFIMLSKARNYYRNLVYDFLNDDVTKTYINTIKKRGNGYIVYNGSGNQKILQSLAGGELKKASDTEIFMYDSDFAIIEYDNDGNKISAMTKQAIFEPSQLGQALGDRDPAVTMHQRIFILLKDSVRRIDINLGVSALDDYIYKNYTNNQKQQNNPTNPQQSNANKIKELYQLYKDGALSKEEFELEKKKILNTNNQPANTNSSTKTVNAIEFAIVQKFNAQHGTNFTNMQEVQNYIQNNQ